MKDLDLTFLGECTNEQIKMLADVLIFDKDGDPRLTESLTSSMEYSTFYPNNLHMMLPCIIEELQNYGGDSFMNFFRGHGVTYREILEDVCDKLDVNYNKASSTELIEQYLLQKFLIMSVDKMTEDDVKHLSENLTKAKLIDQLKVLKAGSPVFLRLVTVLVLSIAKKTGMKMIGSWVAKFMGSKAFTIFTGPIGWVITGVWTLTDISGTAYRVTIPATIVVAYLRMVAGKSDAELEDLLK